MSTPWLDSLSDDWSVSETHTTPVSKALVPQSSPAVQNSPSRIPVPARRSVQNHSHSPIDKKVTRPCHFYHREPPTPKRRTPITPKKLRSPLPGEIKAFSPKPSSRRSSMRVSSRLTPVAAEKKPKPPTMDTHSPLRSVSNVSNKSEYDTTSTVQIKPKKGRDERGSTPEWRKRLVRGEFGAGEQRDLFAPIGLESVFKPPTPGSSAQKDLNPFTKQEDHLWDFTDTTSRRSSTVDDDDVDADEERVNDENYTEMESPFGTVNVRSKPKELNNDENSAVDQEGSSQAENTSMRTASRLEDLRNEGITPITFTQPNTLEGNAPSELVKSALKQVTNKLASLSIDNGSRPGSSASDSFLFNNNNNNNNKDTENGIDGSSQEDSLLDLTSQSLPQDLSMGTVDFSSRRPSSRPLPGKFSPSPFPSQSKSSATLANTKIRSSPLFNPSHGHGSPVLPLPSSSHVRPSTSGAADAPTKDIAMPSSGSPLKLFGEHDTFTNNRLLRRMSQFEETFHDGSDGEDPPSPSEEARRKGENRSFLNMRNEPLREISSIYNERLASRNSGRPQLNRFGDGELDQFDFSDTSPYGNKLVYESKDIENRPAFRKKSSGRQQYLHRGSQQESAYGYRSSSSGFTRKPSNWSRNSYNTQDATRSSRVNRKENAAPEAKRVPKAASDPKPKRRRTIMQDVSAESHENGDQASKSANGMSLLQRSLIKQGIQLENSDFLAPPGASLSIQRPRTPTPSQIKLANEAALAASRNYSESNYDNIDYSDSFTMDGDIPFVKITGTSDTSRKGSITTQDYLNEATKIMDLIRSKGRRAAGMTSLQEREGDSEDEEDASFEDESTQEAFSRPPSRDGIDLRKIREQKELNPQILSYLKMYQEKDVEGKVLGEGELHEPRQPSISGPRKRKPSPTDDVAEKIAYDLMTINTQISGFSVRSFPTGSSQNSQAKGVLTSDVLSHLIPAQVNGFTYDRTKNQWVKEDSEHPTSPSAESDEHDPFQDIPDLSVDELQEMLRVHGLDSSTKSLPDQSHDLDVPKLRTEKAHELNVPHQPAANSSPKKADARPPIGRETSVGGEIFIPRPISRIEEQSEEASENLSVIHRKDLLDVQRTPTQHFENSLVPIGTLGHDNSYSFHLSPLADFSVNQSDHHMNLELSYVAQRTNPQSLRQVHGTFALAIEELVKHITAAAPNVTFWDDLRRLVLRQKGLITLHKLNDFCPRLEELDVSDNEIGQLSGIPPPCER
ncbi:hypothetical protein N7495_006456 [Penicillium taxi]|uniref:uncharacterized protein n=1 Tax=Penicillium taxi TaxID=168475 RepID=UPI002544DD97|nr:uncharacterized protein N7495_006456 [Penicillium taxi]KAJ5894765.1 hypothetical protein N7495_006456 [Penicillium taxi]